MDVSLKYNISDFYVGELYIAAKEDNLLAGKGSLYDEEANRKKRILKSNRAIDFTSSDVLSYRIDLDNKLVYTGYLCLFYKFHNQYLCLEDFNLYSEVGKDFYKNLVPLSSLLPKVDYEFPSNLSIKEGLKLFNILFKSPESLYKSSLHNKTDFYVGNLCKCNQIATSRYNKEKINLPQEYLLQRSNAVRITCPRLNYDYGYNEPIYDYSTYSCLFLKHPLGVLNLNNHQVYERGIMRISHLKIEKGKDHYEWMEPLGTFLEESKVRDSHQQLTIPKALKLVKKAYNKV
jgi:hypothetical protein